MVGVILAGGEGSRFSGKTFCKPLLRLNGKYLIEYSLENLRSLRVSEIFIVVGKFADDIKKAVGESYQCIPVTYVRQPCPLGLINALYCASEYIKDEEVVLQLGDEVFIEPDYSAIAEISRYDFLCGYTVPENRQSILENYSILCSDGKIELTVEKPTTVLNEKKGTGFCCFAPECFEVLKENYYAELSKGNICDFFNLLILSGKKGAAVLIANEEININDPEKYAYAKMRMEETESE